VAKRLIGSGFRLGWWVGSVDGVVMPNGIRILSAVLPQYTFRTDRPTYRQTDTQTDRRDTVADRSTSSALTLAILIESDALIKNSLRTNLVADIAAVTMLLAMSVYQIIVSDKLPSSSASVPIIGQSTSVEFYKFCSYRWYEIWFIVFLHCGP